MVTKQQHTNGFSLLLTMLVASVALSVGLVILNVTMKQLDLTTASKESEVAFQAARMGMECLQYLRDSDPAMVTSNGYGATLECYGEEIDFSDSNSDPKIQRYNDASMYFQWDPTGSEPVCAVLEMYIYNPGADGPVAMSHSNQNIDRDCAINDVCTVAISQGYNRSCDEINNPSLYLVQRELTAEF